MIKNSFLKDVNPETLAMYAVSHEDFGQKAVKFSIVIALLDGLHYRKYSGVVQNC